MKNPSNDYKVDFEKARNEIKLTDFMLSHPNFFKINKVKSTKKHLAIDNLVNGERIIVFKHNESKREMYFVANKDEKGDVITFIKNRLNIFGGNSTKNEWAQVAEILENKSSIIINSNVVLDDQHTSPKVFQLSYYNAVKLNDFSYLESRGLNKSFLQSSKFEGRIFNNSYKGNVNVLFPTFHSDDIRGVSIRGNNVKINGKNSDFSNSIWHSNYDKTKPVEEIVLGESPIDVISYAQLKYGDDFDKRNIILISIDGSVRDYLNQFFSNLHIDADTIIKLVNDNDVPGYIHDLRIMKKLDDKFPIEPAYSNLNEEALTFKQTYANDLFHIYAVKNDRDSMKEFFSDRIQLQFFKRHVVIDKPINAKDWNEFLQLSTKTNSISIDKPLGESSQLDENSNSINI